MIILLEISLVFMTRNDCLEAEFSLCSQSERSSKHLEPFNFTYRHIDDVLSINNSDFENYLGQMYIPLTLSLKTRQWATCLRLTWLCSYRSGGTVNFALQFTTIVRFQFSYHKLSIPEYQYPIFSRMAWCSCEKFHTESDANFPISCSGRDMSRNVRNGF